MFCNKCGNSLPDNAVFCNQCGNKVGIVSQSDFNESNKSAEENNTIFSNTNPVNAYTNTNSAVQKFGTNMIVLVILTISMLIAVLTTSPFENGPAFSELFGDFIENMDMWFEILGAMFETGGDIAIAAFLIVMYMAINVGIIVDFILGLISVFTNKKTTKSILSGASLLLVLSVMVIVIGISLGEKLDETGMSMFVSFDISAFAFIELICSMIMIVLCGKVKKEN